MKTLVPLLALLAGAAPAQGLLTLMDLARLVVEARCLRSAALPADHQVAEVRQVLKGPAGLSRLHLFIPTSVSAHTAPSPGEWSLLFLVPRPGPDRLWLVLQAPLAAVALDGPEGRALAGHARRLAAARHDDGALAAELLRGATSSGADLSGSALSDLVARPDLVRALAPQAGAILLARLADLPPSLPAAAHLIHLVGERQAPGWERGLLAALGRPGAAPLAPTVGLVLRQRLGRDGVAMLAEAATRGPDASHLIALGATGAEEALPLLGSLLEDPRAGAAAAEALAWHRTRGALELLTRAALAVPAAEEERAAALLEALRRHPSPAGRRLLGELAAGRTPSPHGPLAARILAGR